MRGIIPTSFLLGLPIFVAPECLNIYPACGFDRENFNLLLHVSLFVLIPFFLKAKFSISHTMFLVLLIYSGYLVVAFVKWSLYSLVLLFSLAPFVVAWGGAKAKSSNNSL